MSLVASIVSWFNESRLANIELMKKYPDEVQQETFKSLIDRAKNTEWGKKYGYSDIKTYQDFANNVPVSDYEDLKPYIDRVKRGEKDILWPGETKWFAKSSGTTSDKSKFIPVTNESLEDCHFRGGKDIIALYTKINPTSKIFTGKSLVLGGSHEINSIDNKSYYGDLSAVIIENLPFWAKFLKANSQETSLMKDWDKKIEKMAEEAINTNVTNMAGVPSWSLLLLKHILKKTGKQNIKELWPNFELFIHGGVSFEPYREQFESIIEQPMNYMETYNASEGFFAIQNNLNTKDMLLMLDYGIFYEFIPMDTFGTGNEKIIPLHEVETNVNYAMLISTNGGLWRYLIGDTVMFTSKYPFKIIITGRTKQFINTFGEELIVDNADKAIQIATHRTNSLIKEYTGAPIYPTETQKGGHEWIFEFDKKPEDIEYFIDVFDTALKNLNSDYEAKRYHNMTINYPKVHIAPDGLFYKWMKQRGKMGGQNKVPRLANHRKYIEELLQIMNKPESNND